MNWNWIHENLILFVVAINCGGVAGILILDQIIIYFKYKRIIK